eukprot:254022-Prorocentrum_minimum.AAC.1
MPAPNRAGAGRRRRVCKLKLCASPVCTSTRPSQYMSSFCAPSREPRRVTHVARRRTVLRGRERAAALHKCHAGVPYGVKREPPRYTCVTSAY